MLLRAGINDALLACNLTNELNKVLFCGYLVWLDFAVIYMEQLLGKPRVLLGWVGGVINQT